MATSDPAVSGEIAGLPSFDGLWGRDAFRETCRGLFARPEVSLARTAASELAVFRNAHLRALAVRPEAGNTPPDVLAKGSFDALRDPAIAPAGTGAALARVLAGQVFFMNPPLHDPARAILTCQLSPRAAQGLEPTADEIIAELLAELTGSVDFVRDFAEPLAARFWGRFVDMDADEQTAVVELVRTLGVFLWREPTPAEVFAFDTAAAGYAEALAHAAQRALGAGLPVVTEMAAEVARLAPIDDPARAGVAPADVAAFLAGNLFDGFHTAALGVANVVYSVLRHDGVLARLRQEPALINAAVFEGLRIEPPALFLTRYALEDFTFEGVRIRAGARIAMCWAAGNLDPQAFPEPEAFRLDRPLRGAATFGAGAQICPGRLVVAMLAQRTLKALVESGLEFALDAASCAWEERSSMAQLAAMPVTVSR
jgi:cytochrome P450